MGKTKVPVTSLTGRHVWWSGASRLISQLMTVFIPPCPVLQGHTGVGDKCPTLKGLMVWLKERDTHIWEENHPDQAGAPQSQPQHRQ